MERCCVCHQGQIRKKTKTKTAELCVNLYLCVIKYYLILSLSPSNLTYSGRRHIGSFFINEAVGRVPRAVFSIRGLTGLFFMHQSLCERSSFLLLVFGLEFDHHGCSHFGMLCTNEEHEKVAS